MKKRILINGRFSSHHFAIRNVIYNIAEQLTKVNEYDVFIILNADSDSEDFKKLSIKIIYNEIPADSAIRNHLFTMFRLPKILHENRIDLVIYPQICIFLKNPCKSLLYMHDLIEYKLPNQSKLQLIFRKFAYPYVCKKSTRIIAVSENTKADLNSILNVPKEKIDVVYDGADINLKPINKEKARYYLKQKYGISKYILYIGYLTHPQKNLLHLISEFKLFNEKRPEYMLVFAGPKGLNAETILNSAKEKGIPFKYLGKVPYSDLAYLYSGCEVFCFPSKYEGFGMPVLEAMKCGAPVISSNISSIPEILNNSHYLIDPNIKGELAIKLEKIISSDHEIIISQNLKQAEKFSWDNHGNKLIQIISKII